MCQVVYAVIYLAGTILLPGDYDKCFLGYLTGYKTLFEARQVGNREHMTGSWFMYANVQLMKMELGFILTFT